MEIFDTMKNYQIALQRAEKLNALEWDEEDKKELLKEYIQKPVHLALEWADSKNDWKTFQYILNKYPTLLEHIKRTMVLEWDCVKEEFFKQKCTFVNN